MNPYREKPWLRLYRADQPTTIASRSPDCLSAFRRTAEGWPDAPAILYFDRKITYAELDHESDALAVALSERGFARGDRLALYLQNVPQFIIAVIAAWKVGGIVVPINPMNRAREVSALLADSGARAIVSHDDLYEEVVQTLPDKPRIVFTTSPLDYQNRNDPRLFAGRTKRACKGAEDFVSVVEAARGKRPPHYDPTPSELAFLVYTSGTTGVPKGAMNTHGSALFTTENFLAWIRLQQGQPVVGLAPLFHITGITCQVLAPMVAGSPVVLSYRFDPAVMIESIEEHRATFIIGAITAFIAMMNLPTARREQLGSLTQAISGGAPVPPSVVEGFREKFGIDIHQGYGLTETNAPAILAPLHLENRIDPSSGAFSIGVPLPMIEVSVQDDQGPVPVGESGEIVISGPSVVPGYWNQPEETASAMRPQGFRTGDIGFMDSEGWFYIVDRKKDMINAGGYKVWPREVEDVLYSHPAVLEAAVVGVPDDYRGETVKAVISLKAGQSASPEEIREFCKSKMAAYKYPRIIEILDELPKTASGKILRREIRERG